MTAVVKSGSKSASFGSNARAVAIVAAMAPLVTGIYQESQQDRQKQSERQTAMKEAAARQQQSEIDADRNTAGALQNSLLAQDSGFCARIYFAASQLPNQRVVERTRSVLYAALSLRNADARPTVCGCGKGEGFDQWLQGVAQFFPTDQSSIDKLSALSRELGSACDVDDSPAASRIRDLESQVAALTVQRDSLSAALTSASPISVGSTGAAMPAPAPASAASPPAPGAEGVAAAASAPAPAAGCEVADPGERRRLRVFIQVPDDAVRPDAERLRGALNARAPFKSPGIESVGSARSPKNLEVRYAYPVDRDAAQIVLKALASGGCGGATTGQPQLVYMAKYQGRTDAGVIEVWWPARPNRDPS